MYNNYVMRGDYIGPQRVRVTCDNYITNYTYKDQNPLYQVPFVINYFIYTHTHKQQ